MKILICAGMYYPFRGGYFESIHGLAKRLSSYGHNVYVLTCNTHQKPAHNTLDEISIIRLDCINPKWLFNTFPLPVPNRHNFRILKRVVGENWDIVSTQTRFFAITWIGFFIGKLKRIPVIHTERGATHSIVTSRFISLFAKVLDHTIGFCIVRFSTRSIGVSNATCQFLRHLGAKKPLCIYNGVDTTWWKTQTNTSLTQKRKGEDAYVITFVGRLIYAKGVQDLFHAIKEVNNKQVTVFIIGDGPYRKDLETLRDHLEITSQIHFLGELPQEEIRTILHATDIFINPSHSEGLPRCVLEAGAVGLPIIATDTGGTNEIIGQGRGLLIPTQNSIEMASAIERLLNDSSMRESFGRKIFLYVTEHFNWDRIAEQYVTEFEKYVRNYR